MEHGFNYKWNDKKCKRYILWKRVSAILLVAAIWLGQLGIPGIWEGNQITAQAAVISPGSKVPLKRLSGSGQAFMYYQFVEITEFQSGTTYALLDDVYGYEDAVFELGSGAVLKATNKENGSKGYISGKYGNSAKVKTYVDVITKGRQFDGCVIGGLYQVPNSGTPAEYRYFCGYGGAQNCGPLYAYSYEKAKLSYTNISASLNEIGKQGSTKSTDYTVMIQYDGKNITLDPRSYTVKIVQPDTVVIKAEDSEGNTITTNFQGPLAVRYEGNAKGVTNVPGMQGMWKGESYTISNTAPSRSGYALQNWKDSGTGKTYAKGAVISSMSQSLNLMAQWKDVAKPVITYSGVSVVTRTSDADVKSLVEKALKITDNEPVSECTISVSVPQNIARTAGQKAVTVTVTDRAGNQAVKNCTVDVSARPLEMKKPAFDKDTETLSATLVEPGPDSISETGFVWGVMNNPSLTLNNGKAKTASPVTGLDSTIAVTAEDLQKGVNYYARAYVIAGGITYYSDEIPCGLGLPAYGTFTIKNNGNNTFTVTRSGGSEGTQTIYYRTVNGSAVGGTHFTHTAGTLTFNSGETQKTFNVGETTANTAYTGKAATAYSNEDRTYQVELYRITGGGTLGDTVRASRTMTAGNDYKVDRTIYTTEKSKTQDVSNKWVTDHSGGSRGDVIWRSDRKQNTNANKDNFNCSRVLDETAYSNSLTYIQNTAGSYLYRYAMKAHEQEDGWEHAWMGTHEPYNARTKNKCGGDYQANSIDLNDSVAGEALYTASFQVGQGSTAEKRFPATEIRGDDGGEDTGNLGDTVRSYKARDGVYTDDTTKKRYIKIPISDTVYNYFGSSGRDADRWWVEGFTDYTMIYDDVEPKLVEVAPMAGGLYKAGDSFTVSLIFDEIVDDENSALTNVSVETNWGTAYYIGGANTNVLYFTGTVGTTVSGDLRVNSIVNASQIKDMCAASVTACSGGSGSTTAQVDTSVPNFTVAAGDISAGTGTAKITVNDDKSKTSSLKYVWTDSSAMPADGWVELNAQELAAAKEANGQSFSIRKTPGSGKSNGKWYLHVLGTYAATGETSYRSAMLDFGTESSPVAGSTPLALEVSADNSNWAKTREITINKAGGGTLKYRSTGQTAWTDLDKDSLTATANGYYTFILTEGDQIVTKSIPIEKLDNVVPSATIGTPVENNSTETQKDGVYTRLTLPVYPADGESYIAKLEYAWTNSASVPSSGWTSAATNTSTLSYTAAESTETTKYLHLRMTDVAGNTATVKSQAYTLLSQTVVDNHTPRITLTGAPAKWTNDMATLTWSLNNHTGKNYMVTLPDGRTSTDSQGNFLATQNSTYTVTVKDLDYGGSETASLTVDKLDLTAPTVSVSGVPDTWKNSNQSLTFTTSDSQSGVGKAYYKIVSSDSEIPEDGLTAFTGSSRKVDVTENGTWYVYYKFFDQAGDDTTGRPANMTEGFAGPVQIDKAAPELTINGGLTGASALDLTLQASFGPSGGTVRGGLSTGTSAVLPDLTVAGGTGGSKSATYTVTGKGTYAFQAESGTGETASKNVTVCQAVFNPQNGGTNEAQLVVKGGKLTEPDTVLSKEGHTFEGWYTTADGGSKWSFEDDMVSQDTTLYARWKANIYQVTLPETQIGYTLAFTDGGTGAVEYSKDCVLQFTLAEGFSEIEGEFAVKANGKTVPVVNGTITITNVTEDLTITVEGVADVTGPETEIRVGDYNWSGFIEDITFDVAFKDTQTVTMSADDAASGVAQMEYYVSNQALTMEEVEALEPSKWTVYTEGFPISEEGKYIIYGKATDRIGNVTWLSSNGLEIMRTPPAINGIEDGETYYGDVTFTVPEGTVKEVTVDGVELTAVDGVYTIKADDETHTVVVTDKAGNVSEITVTVNKIPEIVTQTTDVTVTAGETAEITFEADGVGVGYQWYVDKKDGEGFVAIPDAKESTYTIEETQAAFDGYEYKCVVVDDDGNPIGGVESAVVTLTVNSIDQEAPELTAVNETISRKADGKMTRLTTDMEYRLKGSLEFVDVTNGNMAFAAGTYEVRYKGKTNYNPSPVTEVTIAAGRKLTVSVPNQQTGYTLVTDKEELDWKEDVSFTFTLADGYGRTEDFKITVNGNEVKLSDEGRYIIPKVQEDIEITVEGVADVTGPEAEICVGESRWSGFIEDITFDIAFKDTQTVTMSAVDYESGVAQTAYYVSNQVLTREEVEALEPSKWTAYEGGFPISEESKYVIYGRVTDQSGNVTYLSSNGLEIMRTPPAITGIEDGKTYYGDVTFTVPEERVKEVTVDGVEVTAVDGVYTIKGDDKKHTVVVTDKAGNRNEITITANRLPKTVIQTADAEVTLGETAEFTFETDGTGVGYQWYVDKNDGDGFTAIPNAEESTYTIEDTKLAFNGYQYKCIVVDKGGNPAGNVESKVVTLTVNKIDQEAPELTAEDETISGKADGKIIGLTTEMEYRLKGDSGYKDVMDTDMAFAAGTYKVRYKETAKYKPSLVAEVTIRAGKKLTVSVPEKQTGYTLVTDKEELDWKDNVSFTFTLADGYRKTKDFRLTVNGKEVMLSKEGRYTIPKVQEDIVITVEGVVGNPNKGKVTKAEAEQNALSMNAKLKVSQTGKKINIAWGKVAGADGYDVYVQYCGMKFTKKSITAVKSGGTTKVTVMRINGKPLNLKKNYKIYVLAYKWTGGKKVTLGETITAHIVGRKNVINTNAKAVKVMKSSYTLNKGRTAQIKARTVLVSPGKKQLSDAHAKEFRYATTNKKVATVSRKGKIKAVGKGTCVIYVYARNGYARKVKVKVR